MPANWDHVEKLFAEAMERPPGEREAFVRAVAGEDAALAEEVLSLLRHGGAAAEDWGEDAAGFGAPLLADADYSAGDRLGPYELEHPLGRGGMGTVWRARRTDDLRLRVAVKVVRRGLDTADVRHRFRQEHRLLAALDHPGIARLLDGGVTPDGLPFFVMEYVDGEPIDRYCDRRRLAVEDRLRLFQQVCDAVQYAHQRLVVHRDLKPSNILVAEDEAGRPHAKLLDFGIAKVLQPDEMGLSGLFTRVEQRLLTPAYASPEQLAGDAVTTASDVYGLGVLLYELLTGHPPRPRRRLPLPPPEDPLRPSEAVGRTEALERGDGTTETVTPEAVGAARRTPTERLRRALAGDLDTIVLMALRREPERRYSSAAQLAEDVERHRAGQTVRARPDTLGYRATTFVRRHRWGVGAASLFLVLLVAFAATMAVERGRTARAAARARAVADVLGGLFAATNPMVADGDTLTVYDFLRLSEGRLRSDLATQPEVLAEVLGVVGGAYRDMTQFARADTTLRDALALRRRLDPRGPMTAHALGELATLQFMRGDLVGALSTATEWLLLLKGLYGEDDPRLVPAYGRIAAVHLQAHRLDSARAVLDRGLAITRPLRAADPGAHLGLVGLEGWYYAETGEHDESVRVAREILALHARTGAPQADVALAERILGDQLYHAGDFAGADPPLRSSLARYRRVFGPDNRYVALVLGHLAANAAAAGRNEEADRLFPQALAMKARYYGGDHPEIGFSLLTYGRFLLLEGRPAEALPLLVRAEALWGAARGAESDERRQASALAALVLFDAGEHTAAVDTIEAIWARAGGEPPGRGRAILQLALAALRERQGRGAEAAALRRDAAVFLRASPYRREVE